MQAGVAVGLCCETSDSRVGGALLAGRLCALPLAASTWYASTAGLSAHFAHHENAAETTSVRLARFTLAHELGHSLAYEYLSDPFAH